MVPPCAGAGFWAAVGLQRCMIIAAFVCRTSAIMTLWANHINLACHNASHISDLICAGSTCKTKKTRLKEKKMPLSLDPVPQKHVVSYIIQRPCFNK